MAVVYGTPLADLGKVASYSEQLLQQKQAEAQQRRDDRKAYGQAIAAKQQEYADQRNGSTSNSLSDFLKQSGSKGGANRTKNLTPEQRVQAATKAANARWKKANAQ